MRKIMKRGFCLFLVAVLLAGLVPCAFANEAMSTGEVEASEAATEAAEETTAPPETAVPSESTEPPSETTEPPEATETTESETEVTEPERVPFSMRQDLILLDKLDAETRFLAKHEYGTAAELESHKEKSTDRISELEQERNALRNQLRTATRREDAPAVESLKFRIKEVSSEIKALRQEVKLCDGIEARSALMERNLEQLQQEQELERKEEEQHELFRRGGRSGRPFESERR